MSRAFFKGIFAGTTLSVVGVAGASILTDLPARPSVTAQAVPSSAAPEPTQSVAITAVDDVLPNRDAVAPVSEPAADAIAEIATDEAPRVAPKTTVPSVEFTNEAVANPQIARAETHSAPPLARSARPAAPYVDAAAKIPADTLRPAMRAPVTPVPVLGALAETGPAPEALETGGNLPSLVSATAPRSAAPVGLAAPDVEEGDIAVSTAPAALPAADKEVVASLDTGASEDIEVANEPETAVPDQQDIEVAAVEAEPAPALPVTTPTVPAQQPATLPSVTQEADTTARPSIGRPATSLLDRSTPTDDAAQTEDTAERAAPNEDGVPQKPLERYKATFDNPEGRPLLALVLMDNGQNLDSAEVGVEALGSFPHPISIAVDTSLPAATERAEKYRSMGFEVMALINLPPNLAATDTEVAMSAAMGVIPEAVGILEGDGDGLQGNRAMSDQVAAILNDTGHGIVWRPNGLDTAQKLAAREGVASRTLFRDFDSKGQTPVVIRRFLDQAAFRAGQEGSVIMVGRIRPDTISALLLWALQDRAQRIAVAPVSAALLPAPEDEEAAAAGN